MANENLLEEINDKSLTLMGLSSFIVAQWYTRQYYMGITWMHIASGLADTLTWSHSLHPGWKQQWFDGLTDVTVVGTGSKILSNWENKSETPYSQLGSTD